MLAAVVKQAAFLLGNSYLAENLASLYHADKMNVAAIGNLVPQLHIHHVVRYQTDKAWPAPIWGKFAAIPYTQQQITDNIAQVKEKLKKLGTRMK